MARKSITNRTELHAERKRLIQQLNYQNKVIHEGVERFSKWLAPIGMMTAAAGAVVPFMRNPLATMGTSLAKSAYGQLMNRRKTTGQALAPTTVPHREGNHWVVPAMEGVIGSAIKNFGPKLLEVLLKKR